MLERYAMKVAHTVLRGGSDSDATPLPDHLAGGTLRVFRLRVFSAPKQSHIINVIS